MYLGHHHLFSYLARKGILQRNFLHLSKTFLKKRAGKRACDIVGNFLVIIQAILDFDLVEDNDGSILCLHILNSSLLKETKSRIHGS